MDLSSDDILNERFESFINLKSVDKYFENEEIDCVLDVHSICSENEAIFTIISEDEIINIKIFINNSTSQNLLNFKTPTRIKNIAGRKIVSNKTSSFLLTRDGHLIKFKSSRALDFDNITPSVIYLECHCFENDKSCFLMVSEENSKKIVLQLYDQFFETGDYICSRKEVDLIIEEDQITTLENDMSSEKICQDYVFASEMLIDIMDNETALEFFNLFLSIDAKEEGVNDIVLLSINDRLMFVKYRESFENTRKRGSEEIDDKISIEPVLISKGKIKMIKFCNDSLMIVDDFWMLTIYFRCALSKIIKKREIPLIGEVNCFRFTEDYLIYSNERSVTFMRFSGPASEEPEIFEVDLKMVITFTIIKKFLIAIDRNHFFYYLPIRPPIFIHDQIKRNDEYVEVMDAEILEYPLAIQYLHSAENEFKCLSNEIEIECNMNLLLDHLLKYKETFVPGSAKIKFHPGRPKNVGAGDIVCNPTNPRSGHTFIEIAIDLEPILSPFSFTIAFYRHTKNKGTLVRHVDVKEKKKTEFSIYMPAEMGDNPNNNFMELFVHFNFNSSNDRHVLQFPITIKSIEENELYQSVVHTEFDECIRILDNITNQTNV